MKKILVLIAVITCIAVPKVFSQYKYACFENKNNKKLQLTVYFKKDKAVLIQYKGQKKAVPLIYSTTEQTGNDAGAPSFFWKETYLVKTGKRITGNYVFTNGGTYELQLGYINKKTGQNIPFTIIGSLAGENFSAYRDTPCF